MKTMFIPAKSRLDIRLSSEAITRLPEKVGLITTIQHLHKLDDVKKQLPNAVIGGQLLGCDASAAERIKGSVDAFLYIGTGSFHPAYAALKTGLPVWQWNPATGALDRIKKEAVEAFEKQKKGALVKFLSAETAGILLCTKHGQMNVKKALELAARKDKKYYIFAFDTLDFNELENFPFIGAWVNTACPRIADRKGVINADDIL